MDLNPSLPAESFEFIRPIASITMLHSIIGFNMMYTMIFDFDSMELRDTKLSYHHNDGDNIIPINDR
jgi:hypothetical protein